MAAKKQQTHAKRARELAVKEKRERKRAKKAERAAGGGMPGADNGSGAPDAERQAEETASEWIR
jgi:hypothetical protein